MRAGRGTASAFLKINRPQGNQRSRPGLGRGGGGGQGEKAGEAAWSGGILGPSTAVVCLGRKSAFFLPLLLPLFSSSFAFLFAFAFLAQSLSITSLFILVSSSSLPFVFPPSALLGPCLFCPQCQFPPFPFPHLWGLLHQFLTLCWVLGSRGSLGLSLSPSYSMFLSPFLLGPCSCPSCYPASANTLLGASEAPGNPGWEAPGLSLGPDLRKVLVPQIWKSMSMG